MNAERRDAAAPNSLSGLLMVMTAAVLWGTGGPVAKSIYAGADTNPASVAFLRMLLSVPALLLVCRLLLGARAFAINRRDLPLMLVAGALVALYQVLYFASIPRVGVAIATVISLCSAPVIVALLTALITRTAPTRLTLTAMACAILGAALITDVDPARATDGALAGLLLALGAGALYAANTLVGRRLGAGGRVHALQTTSVGFAFGALVLFVVALSAGLVTEYPVTGWARLAYLGLGPTALAYALFYAGMRATAATAASIASLMEPLTATLLAVLVFGEAFTLQSGLGAALLLAAMMVLVYEGRA